MDTINKTWLNIELNDQPKMAFYATVYINGGKGMRKFKEYLLDIFIHITYVIYKN